MLPVTIDVKSRKPISAQLVDSIKLLVCMGQLSADESLPSVRSLAGELAINPNTIQKAYAELERNKIIYSIPGRGSFVSSDTEAITEAQKSTLLSELSEFARRAADLGITEEEAVAALKKSWREINDKN